MEEPSGQAGGARGPAPLLSDGILALTGHAGGERQQRSDQLILVCFTATEPNQLLMTCCVTRDGTENSQPNKALAGWRRTVASVAMV